MQTSLVSKIALMLCIPLMFEISVISTSLILMKEIDEARVQRQRIGSIMSSYVTVLSSIISDYIRFIGFMEGRSLATRQEANQVFERSSSSLRELELKCRAAKMNFKDIRRVILRNRGRFTEGRNPPPVITSEQMKLRNQARDIIVDVIEAIHERLHARIDKSLSEDSQERELFVRLNTILLAAFLASLLLTLGLGVLISNLITKRIAYIQANAERLSKDEELLPPLRGDDEIGVLDRNLRTMAYELWKAEQQDIQLIENSADIVCALSSDLVILRMNAASHAILNIAPEDLIDKSVIELVFQDEQVDCVNSFEQARHEKVAHSFENEIVTAEGERVSALWSVQWSEADEIFICVMRDNRDRKLAEARRRDLLAVVSHDLRSPLTAARLSLEMLELQADEDSDEARKLGIASRSVNYVVGITNDLIDLLRIQQGKLALDLCLSTIAECRKLVSQRLSANEISFTIEAETGSSFFMIDEEYVPRVLLALARHATLAGAGSPVKVSIIGGDANAFILFRVEAGDAAGTAGGDSQAGRTSWEVSLSLCREIAERLHGEFVTTWNARGVPIYELHLPTVSVS